MLRIWHFGLPSCDVDRPFSLYARTSALPAHPAHDGLAHLVVGEAISFDTYFGSFGVGKWRRHTSLRDLSLTLEARGDLLLEVVHERIDAEPVVIAAADVSSRALTTHELRLPPLDTLATGMVYLRVTCTGEPAAVSGGAWCTRDDPPRAVTLAVVITTFNRPLHVRANLAHLRRALEARSEMLDRVSVVVVDNGRNLQLGPSERAANVTVLPNPNTGGSGGFARGLMHVRAAGRATHVLFMDDDVSFDPEIVFRTIALLSFADDPNLCIAGAMLASERPTELFEAGAQYRGRSLNPNRALGQGLDLEAVHDLLVAELDDDPIDYGAWWFSAFPVALTPDNPAPTFVRGDDVLWGLLHTREHTITSNGIGLWHEGFERKNGPITWFYETRNFALVGVLAVPGYRWWHALFRYVNLCARSLFSLKYASAANITFAMREFLLGPEHWMTNDQSALNERVAGFDGERIEKLPPELCRVDDLPRPHGAGRVVAGVLSIGTLGGHLLPPALDRRPLGAVPLQHRVLGASPGHAAILYRDDDGTHGYLAPRDRRRFLALFGEMVRTAGRIPWSFGRVGRAYRRAYPQMVGDDYWRRQADPDADELGDVATLVPA